MFILSSEGEGFEILEGILKQNPNQWELTEKFAAIWLADAQKILMIPGNYKSHTQEDLDHILNKKFEEFRTQK
jgi:hypothetical protein